MGVPRVVQEEYCDPRAASTLLPVQGQNVGCTQEDHAMGGCEEREENRRKKMEAVGLDPNAEEGEDGEWEVMKEDDTEMEWNAQRAVAGLWS